MRILFKMLGVCALLGQAAAADRALAAWWREDGLISWEQQEELEAVASQRERWCGLVELWLGEEEARAQECGDVAAGAGRGRLGWSVSLDSLGRVRAQRGNAVARLGQWRLSGAAQADSGWGAASWERGQLRWQSRSRTLMVGDFSGTEAGLDAWAGDWRGALLQERGAGWSARLLGEMPATAGVLGAYSAGSGGARGELGLLRVRQRPLLWARVVHRESQISVRCGDPRQGCWSAGRYRLPLPPWPLVLGGSGYMRSGDELPPLLDLPASAAQTRLWSTQWQELRAGAWTLRLGETAVRRAGADSVAWRLQGERRRAAGRLAASAACRAVRTDCGLPRLELGGGFRPWPRGADSLFSEARLQASRLELLGHAPRLRVGWQRRIGPRVTLLQSGILQEDWPRHPVWTLRQESRLQIPAGRGLHLGLRWSLQGLRRAAPRLRDCGMQVEMEF